MKMWNRARVTLSIRERVCGGIPKDQKLIEGWVAANMPEVSAEKQAKLVAKTAAELPAATEEKAEKMWTTFKVAKPDGYIFIEGRQIKAMLKESANILREALITSEKSEKGKDKAAEKAKSRFTAIRSKVAERLFVEEDRVVFDRNGKRLTEPDGSEERAIHVMTAQGPRDALKRTDFVAAPATISFHLKWVNDSVVDIELVKIFFEHACENGLGADRSQGNGRFAVVAIEPID